MTKDVELHSSTWKTMKQALTGLTETASVSSSGYMNYMNPHSGSYGISRGSTGFGKRVEDLVKISEQVQRLIAEKDTDGVVSYSYHDDTSTAQTLQSKLSTLERYAGNVPTYIKDKIDHPFYEAMDKVGAKLEALNIQQYKTTNKVGYKRIESVTDPYGHPVGTKEVVPAEIGIDELYKVDSPYRTALQKSYEEFKNSKGYRAHKLTETEYVQAMHQTRAFEYISIDDEKSKIEMWRDIALGAGLVVLSIFCPPAGAVAGVALASAEMYSAATGKDWGTGRKLDATERTLRGTFALFDLIPAGKYLGTLAKTGKTAGLTAVKNSLKTTLKEGLEQGARNLDSFKGVLKNAKGLGDNVLSQIKTYGKQLDNLRPSKILSNSAESLSDGLRHADNVLSEAAQNFRLNIGLEPQLADGVLSSGGGRLSHLADNLSAFAKNLDGSVDDVMEAGSKAGTENFRLIPGEPGVVTGGNSTNLGKNMLEEMGIKRSAKWKGYQAQHIIPSEMASHPVIQKMGMNLDDASNGKFLRIPDDTISPMSRHRGYHSTYNDFVKSKLDQIDINLSPEDLQVEVKKLQRNLNVLQSKGLPLYPNQGATQELWERFYNKLD